MIKCLKKSASKHQVLDLDKMISVGLDANVFNALEKLAAKDAIFEFSKNKFHYYGRLLISIIDPVTGKQLAINDFPDGDMTVVYANSGCNINNSCADLLQRYGCFFSRASKRSIFTYINGVGVIRNEENIENIENKGNIENISNQKKSDFTFLFTLYFIGTNENLKNVVYTARKNRINRIINGEEGQLYIELHGHGLKFDDQKNRFSV